MVLTDSQSGSYDVTDDVITFMDMLRRLTNCRIIIIIIIITIIIIINHCRKFGAKYLGERGRGARGICKLSPFNQQKGRGLVT